MRERAKKVARISATDVGFGPGMWVWVWGGTVSLPHCVIPTLVTPRFNANKYTVKIARAMIVLLPMS